jgi:hypothetical protein
VASGTGQGRSAKAANLCQAGQHIPGTSPPRRALENRRLCLDTTRTNMLLCPNAKVCNAVLHSGLASMS